MSKRAVVGYHSHCFDGMCSAAAFTHLLREVEGGGLDIEYHGLDHQPGGSHVPESVLAGDINAVVDFRYTTSSRLTWWFDHHVSGIINDEEQSHFDADDSGRKFYDPAYGSCCQFIADVGRDSFGVDMGSLAEMIRWADLIDAARFVDARQAVELKEPALQLMTVLEVYGDDSFLRPRIAQLAGGAELDSIATDASVQKLFKPLQQEHEQTCAAIRLKAESRDGVVFFDLIGSERDRYNKFIPYWLYPECRYTVALTASTSRTKVSVGSNPWAPIARSHDIAEICGRYGGGGHPVVGAVSLQPGEVDRARQIATEILAELAS